MKKLYVNIYDYIFSIAYVLTDRRLNTIYVKDPSSFYVEELIDSTILTKDGDYAVIEVVKKGIDTFEAIRFLVKETGIPQSNFYFLGLKDKDSTSKQYLFVKRQLISGRVDIETPSLKARVVGFTNGKPDKRVLVGNRFRIVFEPRSENDYWTAREIMGLATEKGLPNYYGYQRFGINRPVNHIAGRYLIELDDRFFFNTFVRDIWVTESNESVLSRLKLEFSSEAYYEKKCMEQSPYSSCGVFVNSLLKNLISDAYSSYLFNELLTRIIDWNNGILPELDLPTIGCSTKLYEEILRIESLAIRDKDLLKCWKRSSMVKPLEPSVSIGKGLLTIEFSLPRGSYATIVLRELFKENLRLNYSGKHLELSSFQNGLV
ncbi:tRNA pseudouridine(13) synthase TruD [Thermogladius sp. 4427co]|uniref:tRNA pseudouridine(13) synthase TruD n=1 Tax=Thermogladius sp. 4427co TaxID=3450718 RepID=UPI003F79B2CD